MHHANPANHCIWEPNESLITSYACINIVHAIQRYTHIFSLYIYVYVCIFWLFFLYIHTYSPTYIHTYLNIYISDSITTPTLPLPSLDPPSSLAGSETSPISDPMREARHATAELQRRCRSKFSVFEKKKCNNTKSAGKVGNIVINKVTPRNGSFVVKRNTEVWNSGCPDERNCYLWAFLHCQTSHPNHKLRVMRQKVKKNRSCTL